MTNAGYKQFVESTHHAPPPHWTGGAIPAGMEQMPVVFVNRADVAEYVARRSRQEKRVYPWGNEAAARSWRI